MAARAVGLVLRAAATDCILVNETIDSRSRKQSDEVRCTVTLRSLLLLLLFLHIFREQIVQIFA